MTDQSKQWIITEQGIKEVAAEIADFQRKGEERGLVLREHIIAGMITKHAQTAPGPSCTLCGSPMAFQCPKCGSTPQPIEAAPQRKRGEKWERVDLQLLEDALFIAQAVDANEDRAERMRLTGEVIHELIKSRAAAPPQGTPKPEPDRCPRCASTDKLFLHNACYEECQECPHPWHSTVAAQKEKP